MDWKRLAQFALLGSSDLEQYAVLLVRVAIGLFFAISGANKLFVAGGTKPVCDTLVKSFFIWLLCSGPGRFSVDYWLAGKLLR
jgi:uncharacterized membrane protein YphA (DoxX/SURF4 family)